MSEEIELWAPPHLDTQDVATAMNKWMTQHPDRIPFQRNLQDHVSSMWPVLWHLKTKFIIQLNTNTRRATAPTTQTQHNKCAICYNSLESGTEVLPCTHVFHTMCIHKWLQRSDTCPLCRANI